MSRLLLPGILNSLVQAVDFGPPETATIVPASLTNMGFGVAWSGNSNGISWSEYTDGNTDNVMYMGENQNGWWNLTPWIRFPLGILPGAQFTRARLRLYLDAKGAGIDSSGYTVNVATKIESNAGFINSSGTFTTWAATGRTNIGSFLVNNSVPATANWFEVELDPEHLTTILALPGWSGGNYVAYSLQRTPPTQPPDTVARWSTIRTGRSPNATFMPQLLVDFNGYFSPV